MVEVKQHNSTPPNIKFKHLYEHMGKTQSLKTTFYLRVGIRPINKTGLTGYQPLSHARAPCPVVVSVMVQHLAFKTPTGHFQLSRRNGPNALSTVSITYSIIFVS